MDAMGLGWVITMPKDNRPLILEKSGGLQGFFILSRPRTDARGRCLLRYERIQRRRLQGWGRSHQRIRERAGTALDASDRRRRRPMSEFDRRTSLIYDGLNDVVCPYDRDRNPASHGITAPAARPNGTWLQIGGWLHMQSDMAKKLRPSKLTAHSMRKPRRLRISGHLRALAIQKGFALEVTVQGTRVRLIDEGIGNAVKNSERHRASFSERKAIGFLDDCAPDER